MRGLPTSQMEEALGELISYGRVNSPEKWDMIRGAAMVAWKGQVEYRIKPAPAKNDGG